MQHHAKGKENSYTIRKAQFLLFINLNVIQTNMTKRILPQINNKASKPFQ